MQKCCTCSFIAYLVRFQPETLQSITDRGRANIYLIYQPVIPIIGRNAPPKPPNARTPAKVPRNPFALFLNPDVDVLLYISAIACAVYYGVTATISTLFVQTYPFLNETTIGLCYLAIGGGMIVGSSFTGRILDGEYQRFKRKALELVDDESAVNLNKEDSFPLEEVRWIWGMSKQGIDKTTIAGTPPAGPHLYHYYECGYSGVWMVHPGKGKHSCASDSPVHQ